MAKLTLQNITTGYLTADAYNANNAAIIAALENTVSRDGTTPNQMAAALDMNSQDLNNVGDINAQASTINVAGFILNGEVIAVNNALATATDALAVAFTPTNPLGPITTLQDALDDDYLRNDRDEALTGNFSASGTIIATGALSGLSLTADSAYQDSGRLSADGLSVQRQVVESYTGVDWWIGRNVEVNGGVPQYGRAGDGWCQITMRTDTLDGLMTLSAGDNDQAAGTAISGNVNASIEIDGQTLSPAIRMEIEGVTIATITDSGLSLNAAGQIQFPATQNPSANVNTLDDYQEGTFTPTLRDISGSDAESQTYTVQTGNYTKIGNTVFYDLHIEMLSLGSLTLLAHVGIDDIPYTPATAAGRSYPCAVYLEAVNITATHAVTGDLVDSGGNVGIYLISWDATTGGTGLTTTEISASGIIRVSGHFQV